MLGLDYDQFHKLSISEPEAMWNYVAQDVVWNKPYSSVVEDKESVFPKWFVGGQINMCYNCLDRQVNEGYGNDIAVIYDSPIRNIIEKFTYQELLDKVSLMAGVFVQQCDMTKEDRVFVYLPMIPEAFIAILACTRIGATYTSTFGEFAPKEIAERIKQFKPKLIVTSNTVRISNMVINYKRNIDDAIQFSNFKPEFCIVYNIPNNEIANMIPNRDLDWSTEILKARPQDAVPVPSSHPLFVCYTSGTTGNLKGMVMETGGILVVTKYYMKYFFNMKPNETVFGVTTFSWILGPNLSYGCLMCRNPFIIYEGKPIDRSSVLQILRILNQHQVVNFVCLPMVMRTFRKYCDEKDFKIKFKHLKSISFAGELFDSVLQKWVEQTFNCPLYNVWGQTEIGGIIYGPNLGLNRSLQSIEESPSIMIPGVVGIVVDKDTGKELPIGSRGRLLLKLPLIPSRARTIFENDDRFYELFFKKYPGYFDTMDSAVFITDSTMQILSRDDTVIHISGLRIDGSRIEEAVLLDENVESASIIALEDPITGFVPFGFLVPQYNNCLTNEQIIETAIKNVEENIGKLASFQKAVVVPNLPKTRAGKTFKISLEMMANGKEYKVPSITENREIYSTIYNILLDAGLSPRLPVDF